MTSRLEQIEDDWKRGPLTRRADARRPLPKGEVNMARRFPVIVNALWRTGCVPQDAYPRFICTKEKDTGLELTRRTHNHLVISFFRRHLMR